MTDLQDLAQRVEAENKLAWDTNHEGYRAIFNAALTGFIANKDFHGPMSQGSPQAAVEFADEVVIAAIRLSYLPKEPRHEG